MSDRIVGRAPVSVRSRMALAVARCVALPAVLLAFSACGGDASEEPIDPAVAELEVREQLDEYAAAAAAVDAEASAAFFTPGGTLFEPCIPPIVSADSIRAFIRSFPGVTVDSAMLRADTVEVFGRTVMVWGTYFERLRFPGQPESAQHGRFVMEWRRGDDALWRIERYYRVPLPAGWTDAP